MFHFGNMKKLIAITTWAIIFSSCATEEPLLTDKESQSVREAQIAENTRRFNEPDWQTGVSMLNSFAEGASTFSRLHTQYMQKFSHNDVPPVHWKVKDAWLKDQLDALMGEGEVFTDFEKRFSHDIQYVVLDHLEMTLVKEAEPSEAAQLMEDYYFPILERHKAVDLNIMAEALVFAQPYMNEREYNSFRSFILEQGEKNLTHVKENWEELFQKYKDAEGQEKAAYLFEGKRMQQMTKERNYVRDLLGVNVSK